MPRGSSPRRPLLQGRLPRAHFGGAHTDAAVTGRGRSAGRSQRAARVARAAAATAPRQRHARHPHVPMPTSPRCVTSRPLPLCRPRLTSQPPPRVGTAETSAAAAAKVRRTKWRRRRWQQWLSRYHLPSQPWRPTWPRKRRLPPWAPLLKPRRPQLSVRARPRLLATAVPRWERASFSRTQARSR